MKVYLCKKVHWNAVMATKLYYVSELRLARHYKSKDFPKVGEKVQFLADRILGTAVIKESYQNGYAGHFLLENIVPVFERNENAVSESTDILDKASTLTMENIEKLELEMFTIEEKQQEISASFASMESRKKNIYRRISGKNVELSKPAKKKLKSEKKPKSTPKRKIEKTLVEIDSEQKEASCFDESVFST